MPISASPPVISATTLQRFRQLSAPLRDQIAKTPGRDWSADRLKSLFSDGLASNDARFLERIIGTLQSQPLSSLSTEELAQCSRASATAKAEGGPVRYPSDPRVILTIESAAPPLDGPSGPPSTWPKSLSHGLKAERSSVGPWDEYAVSLLARIQPETVRQQLSRFDGKAEVYAWVPKLKASGALEREPQQLTRSGNDGWSDIYGITLELASADELTTVKKEGLFFSIETSAGHFRLNDPTEPLLVQG
jgi:hypothetical protein